MKCNKMFVIQPWNDRTVLPPPVNTFRVKYQTDVQDLLHLLNNIIKLLSKQSPLHNESALLSRFLYKFDQKFRNDIGYRHFKKLNSALKKYLLINLSKDVKNFAAAIPVDNKNYLPTKQMLEYVLVRLMTFAKIMMRIWVCAKQASIFYMDRLKRGESHWMSLMPYALLSRIWSISTILLRHSCTWYTGLYQYLKDLIFMGVNFLPPNYSLPKDLGEWLDIENFDEYGRFEWAQKKDIPITMLLPEDDLTFDTILDYVNDINLVENSETKVAPQKISINLADNVEKEAYQGELVQRNYSTTYCYEQTATEVKGKEVDLGQKIPREYFKTFFKPTSTGNKKCHCPDNVTNNKSLDSFIATEENYRNKNSDLSLTKHLGFMQWQSLRTSLMNLKESLGSNRKIERKFKKIWKEKCTDYEKN